MRPNLNCSNEDYSSQSLIIKFYIQQLLKNTTWIKEIPHGKNPAWEIFYLVLKFIFEDQCVYDSNMIQNSNFINRQEIMNKYSEEDYDNIMNNDAMKILVVFLDKAGGYEQ